MLNLNRIRLLAFRSTGNERKDRRSLLYRHPWLARGLPVMLVLLSLLMPFSLVHAGNPQEVTVTGFFQEDLDGDNRPDKATILCSCVTELDRITVFDGAGDMQVSSDWPMGTDTANDTWIFDIGNKGTANLIIQFRTEGQKHVAELYDDINGDGSVSYHVNGKKVVIDESPYWTLQVTAAGDWLTNTGLPNLNMQALYDGPTLTHFLTSDVAKLYMPHDGVPDVSFTSVDAEQNGAAEYFIGRLITDIPVKYAIERSWVYVNVGRIQSQRPASSLFWPFLNLTPPSPDSSEGLAMRYFDRTPNVPMDWPRAQIVGHTQRGGFVLPGYPVESGYNFRSMQPLVLGQVNDLDLEMPMAYYDLAENHDNIPELHIRLFRGYLQAPASSDRLEIRYSWNQVHPGQMIWDYKLGLMADYPIDDVVAFPDFGVHMVPYEQFSTWVTERTWKLTTFVANEGGDRASDEGIYAWTPWAGVDPTSADNPSGEVFAASTAYISGSSTQPPDKYFTTIWEGYRGEYNFARPLQPWLYFSPIDHRLHLLGAQAGVWNIDARAEVHYLNQDSNPYLDTWHYLEDGIILRSLYYSRNYLVYADHYSVQMKQGNIEPALFESLPPRDHNDWKNLGLLLKQNAMNFVPGDFQAMYDQFAGPQFRVDGGQLTDFRFIQNGVRFVLRLPPGYQWSGELPIAGSEELTPGMNLVQDKGSGLSIQPLTPPNISVQGGNLMTEPEEITKLQPVQINAVLENHGLQDIHFALVRFTAEKDGLSQKLAEFLLAIPGEGSATASAVWTPPESGTWVISAEIEAMDNDLLTGGVTTVRVDTAAIVLPAHEFTWFESLNMGDTTSSRWLWILLLAVALTLTALTIFWIILRKQEDDHA